MIQVINSFLSDFEWLREQADTTEYGDHVNPVDGVTYPGIGQQIPIGVCADVITKLQHLVRGRISDMTMFTRMTLEGQDVPHQAHNDESMGRYGLIVYLNRAEHCKGGTEFVKHKHCDGRIGPADEGELKIMQRDANTRDAWEVTYSVDMAPNRALLFDAALMHRASTPVGFGESACDGRLALVCFFEVYPGDG